VAHSRASVQARAPGGRVLIVDAHNDLLSELSYRRAENRPFAQYWREQLRAGGVGLQVCPVFVARDRVEATALEEALHQVAAFHRAVHEADDAVWVRTQKDVAVLNHDTRLGLLLSLEGVEPITDDLALADVFWHVGVRMASLTWNDANVAAGGAGSASTLGLSEFGTELAGRFLELGVLLDLAHASEQTFADLVALAGDRPVVVSHTGCRGVYDTPRNVSDEQMRLVARSGGVVGMMAHPLAVDPTTPTLARFVDHVDHAVRVAGIEHVGLGPDFIEQVAQSGAAGDPGNLLLPAGVALGDAIEGLAGPADLPRLLDALARRGYVPAAIEAIAAGNFLRVLGASLPAEG
jgi:membrane dipeptidase